MRLLPATRLLGILLLAATFSFAGSHSSSNPFRSDSTQSNTSTANDDTQNCLTVTDAQKHLGRKNCVTGTVVRVEQGNGGITFLDFCADYHSCPFTVVVFRGDLHQVGDVRQLQGRTITVRGTIEEYDDRAEIILRHPQRLGGSASLLTALPKEYDVEKQGHYSAGTFRPTKAKKAKHQPQGAPVSIEDPEVP